MYTTSPAFFCIISILLSPFLGSFMKRQEKVPFVLEDFIKQMPTPRCVEENIRQEKREARKNQFLFIFLLLAGGAWSYNCSRMAVVWRLN